jgi:hypothetical protein
MPSLRKWPNPKLARFAGVRHYQQPAVQMGRRLYAFKPADFRCCANLVDISIAKWLTVSDTHAKTVKLCQNDDFPM